MKKIMRRVLAIALSLSMVFSGFMFSAAKVDAAELSQDEIASIAGSGTMTNMILGKSATVYPGVGEGNATNLTNGSLTNGHCALSTPGWGYSGEGYAIFDLGNYYKSESLDEIIIAYKDMAENDTVVGRTYNIQYSIDQNSWETVYTSGTMAEADLSPDKCTIDNVKTYTGKVRYIKIDYPAVSTYGIQLTEIAVLATNPQLAPMETCDDPAEVTATASGIGKLTFNITAGPDQEDYYYSATLDDASGALLEGNCAAGVDYTVDVPGGNHTVFVQSHKGDAVSPGINSNQVTVNTYETKVTDTDWNYAYQKDVTLSSGTSTEPENAPLSRVTDGLINSDYVTSTKGTAGSWFTIDLVKTWKATSFETIGIWYRSTIGGTFPENGGLKIQYSTDGIDYTDVAVMTQEQFNAQRSGQNAPIRILADVSGVTSGAVRYVRVYYPSAVAYGAQTTEIGVYDIDGDAEEQPTVTVDDPAGFTAESNDYNEITGTITAGPNQEDYVYNIYAGNTLLAEGLSAGAYTIDGVIGGTYDVTVKSYKDGFYSPGLTRTNITVADGFTYSHETLAGVFADYDEDYGTNLVTQGGSTVSGVTATASNGNATNAIDYNAGSRWEASASDPQWIKVDLGSVKSVKAVKAWWETASARDFTVQVSTDDETYKKAAIVNGAASGADRRDTIVFADTLNVRYVMIHDTSRTTQWGHSIFEIAIYDGETVPAGYYNVADYKGAGEPYTYPEEAGKVFAGWYTDDTCTTAYTETTGYAYAKFIDEKVLSTKFQVANDRSAIRFLSSVDSMDYTSVGFKFSGTYGTRTISNKTKTTESLYKKIIAAGETTLPSVFSDESQFFFTYTVRGLDETTPMTWNVTPFFVTLDGTTVEGTAGTFPE